MYGTRSNKQHRRRFRVSELNEIVNAMCNARIAALLSFQPTIQSNGELSEATQGRQRLRDIVEYLPFSAPTLACSIIALCLSGTTNG